MPPGLFKNGTLFQAKGRWHDANLVRFFDDTIRPVGGWRRLQSDANTDFPPLDGVPRGSFAYRTDTGGVVQVFGTTSKLYAVIGGVLKDITPGGFVPGLVSTKFTTATGAYGIGPYGSGWYGSGSQTAQLTEADIWQLVSFGNALAGVCTSDKKLYVWGGDPAVLPTVPAGAPANVVGVVATPERFLFVLGAGGNSRVVAWPSQETTNDWTPSNLNTAGDFEIASSGRLITGRATRGQTLLWTDADVHAATYIGGVFVYRFTRVGDNCGVIGPNVPVVVNGQAFWMGSNGFFTYDGFVKSLRCDVQDYVFGDFNYVQKVKCWGQSISEFNEIWWFYPSAGSDEIDRYVIYNYAEDHWTVGKLSRTTGYDFGAVEKPVLVSPTGTMYQHELLNDKLTIVARLANNVFLADNEWLADGELSRITESPYLESGPFELAEGDNVVKVQRLVPDVKTLGDLNVTLYAAFNPTEDEIAYGPYALAQPTAIRVTARQLRFRLQEVVQEGWRVGKLKLGIRVGGRR